VKRICFVTCRRWPEISESDRLAQQALELRGATVQARAWNDPAAEFAGFDAVVLRSNWDYHFDPDGFRAWLDRLEREGSTVWNPPELVRWNLSKRYLLALRAAGVPTVPTVILDDGSRDGLATVMAEHGWGVVVLKPEIGASAHGTRLVTEATAAEAMATIEPRAVRGSVLIQPFVEEIRSRGEWSLVFVDSVFTHAVLKHPGADEFRVQPRLGGTALAAPPPDGILAAARATVAALPLAPLYARVDGVETSEGFRIMEVEVNEPSLFFTLAPAAAEDFAAALLRAL
jgi:glutathione synthase/RimK-type ligase-like ATP-grasp enzyme